VQVATGIAGTTYTDTVSAGTYTYQVSAVNATGTEGPLSNALSATATAPPQPPGPPALTSATGGVGSVALTWSAPTTGGTATSYNVYRGIFSAGETLLQSGVTSLNYTDNVAAGTYYYEVTAVNGNGEGPRSNEQSATSTPAPPVKPGPPTLTAATGGVGSVALTWSAPTTGGTATSYNVYRGTSSGGEALLRTGVTTLNYTDNVSAGTYFYEVTAVNGSGEGPLSNEASGTATAAPPPPPGPVASFTKACTYSVCIYNSTSTDAGGTITTYAWSGGNNFTGSAYRTAHGYTAAGTFSVVLTVTDSNHAQATASGNVTCTYDQYHRLVCV
jgi:fibronectin type 3 domain-containing protein